MENKKIKWGILGTGRIASSFATALQVVNNSELYAVGSRNEVKAQLFASEFNISRSFGSYEELVQDANTVVVYIATPHNLHLTKSIKIILLSYQEEKS